MMLPQNRGPFTFLQTYRKPSVDVALLTLFVVLVGLKLFSTSYFVYSVVLSTGIGVGIAVSVHAYAHSTFPQPHSLSGSHKLAGAFVGVFAFLMILAYRVEVNAAPVLRVPRRECAYFPCVVRSLSLRRLDLVDLLHV
jgi:hypothetical protein